MAEIPIPEELREKAMETARKVLFEATSKLYSGVELEIATNTLIIAFLQERQEALRRAATAIRSQP